MNNTTMYIQNKTKIFIKQYIYFLPEWRRNPEMLYEEEDFFFGFRWDFTELRGIIGEEREAQHNRTQHLKQPAGVYFPYNLLFL